MKDTIFFIDFDGTISREDVCALMVQTFAREGWEEFNRLWEEKFLSTEECARGTLELIDATPEALNAFFAQMEIDPGFPSFVQWAKHHGHPLYILSDGYDNYIQNILTRKNLNLPYYANHLEYDRGWKIRCYHQDLECQQCGVCKTRLIEELIKPGYITVYIGDGYSDLCPAARCDLVLAKNELARLCQAEGIPYYAYENFFDVQTIVKEFVDA